jgi:hypothetical protein
MKEDLPYFSHDNNARNHPKMKALIAEFGYEGYGKFWALNEKIAEASGAVLDISKKVNKLDLAKELNFDSAGLDVFLKFLSDPEIDLVNVNNGKITTDRVTEQYDFVISKRKKQREKKAKSENGEIVGENDKIASENGEIVGDFNTKDRIIKDSITKDNKTNKGETQSSPEKQLTQSQKDAVELAMLLLTTHRKVIPDYLSGKNDNETVERWAKDIEYLIRIDKKPPETIRRVILWAKTPGNFWFPNIQSGVKLREKFEQLYAKFISENSRSPPGQEYGESLNVPCKSMKEMFSELAQS